MSVSLIILGIVFFKHKSDKLFIKYSSTITSQWGDTMKQIAKRELLI